MKHAHRTQGGSSSTRGAARKDKIPLVFRHRVCLASCPKPKVKRNEVRVSRLKPGDIVAVPFVSSDDPGVSVLYLGEIVEAAKVLSIVFFHNGKTIGYDVKDTTIGSLLKVNDLYTGSFLKTCDEKTHRETPILSPRHHHPIQQPLFPHHRWPRERGVSGWGKISCCRRQG